MYHQQRQVYHYGGDNSLGYAYYESLAARFLQLFQTELIAYGKSYESQGQIAYDAQPVQLLIAVEAQPRHLQRPQKAWPYQYSRHKIGSNIRQMQFFQRPGHHEPGKHGNRYG